MKIRKISWYNNLNIKFKSYIKLKSLRDIFLLSGSTALGQMIVVVFMPLLTRLYTPNDFGLLALYAAILSILSTACCMRYEIVIPLPRADRIAMLALVISVIILFFSVVFIFLILFLYNKHLSLVFNTSQISTFFWLIPFGVLSISLFNISLNWSLRKKLYSTLARTKVVQSFIMVIVQLSMYKFGFISLIIGHVLGVSFGVFKLWTKVLREDSFLIKNFTKRKLLIVAYRYRSFPMFSMWGGLFNCIGTASPTILFTFFFDPSSSGFFFIANRVLNTPLSIIGNAIAKHFFAESPEALRNGTLHCKTKKTILILFLIIITPAFINLLFAEELFSFFLGNEWSTAGKMSQLLTPMIIAQFITAPVGQLLAVKERLALNMSLQGILTILIIISFLIGYFCLDALFTVGLYSMLSTIGYLLFLYFSIKVKPLKNS